MAASGQFRLDLEALGSSAAHVTGQGEDLATAHLSSDNRIVAAQVTRVGDHASDLHQDGINFAAMERAHAQQLRALVNPADGVHGSARG